MSGDNGDSSIGVLDTNPAVLEQQNFWIDPALIEVAGELGRFRERQSSSDFVDYCIRSTIGSILDELQNVFPVYSEDVAKKLDIEL